MIYCKNILILILMMIHMMMGMNFAQAQNKAQDPVEPDKYVSVRLIADKSTIQAGDTVRIGIEQTIYPTWHTYWSNPGDSGTPTDIAWNLPDGFSVSSLQWPTPQKIPFDPLTNYGYENSVTLLQTLTLPAQIPEGSIMLDAQVNLLVCHDICIPESHDVAIVFNGGQAAHADLIARAEALLPEHKDWQAEYFIEDEFFTIDVTAPKKEITSIHEAYEIMLLPEEWGMVENSAGLNLKITDTGFRLYQEKGDRDLSDISKFPFVLKTDDGVSIRLEAKEKAVLSSSASIEAKEKAVLSSSVSKVTDFSVALFLQALFFAFLGGVILNLMPCVFPVLSMKALSLINLNEKEEKKARQYGVSYTLGILVSFALIAALLLGLKAAGEQIGWGFQLQNPAVVTLLAYLVFVIGLNLSGFFEFSSRLSMVGQSLTQKDGNKGAFFTGVLATLVATPCTAPFMGTAMGFALTQSIFVSMPVFLMLGFGLAAPYLLLCFVPALRSRLPRPGAWMETFRQFLAFPLFITAAWLVWVLSQQVSAIGVLCVLIGLVAIAMIIWLGKVWPKGQLAKIFAVFMMLVAIGFAVLPLFTPAATQSAQTSSSPSEQAEAFTPQALEDALNGSDPVFVNMTAAWCITCKVNERVAIQTDSTMEAFATHNVRYLKGDWTNQDPAITAYLDRFGRSGVPLYVYYPPRNAQSGMRPEPVVLPQILTPGILSDLFQ